MTGFATRDPDFDRLLARADRAARSRANVLIVGESGTGKTRLARWLHGRSGRAEAPYVEVHCANLPPELLESELFGHEAGAFTGATTLRIGRFEQAHRGSLFLDEIQEIPATVQAKVLRAIQERRFERVGGGETVAVDARIFAVTRDDPEALVAAGRLRSDLFYRLDVVRLRVPPLRERRDDIALLADTFLEEAVKAHGLGPLRFAPDALRRLTLYDWPGNTRELRHVVESAAILSERAEILATDLPDSLSLASPAVLRSAATAGLSLGEIEDAYIDEVLHRTRGNKSAAAKILGIHRKTLHEKLRARRAGGR